MSILKSALLTVGLTVGVPTAVYFTALGAMVAVPSFQAHALYLHRVKLTWFNDLNVPEQFGFQHNQVIPFHIRSEDGVALHAWHVLPLGLYRRNFDRIARQTVDPKDVTKSINFKLLREDPDARLVLYMHGTGGTLGSGWRPDSYRALYSASPDKIHILAFDYRGYGLSTGTPSEGGILNDTVAVYKWATTVAGIPPERIVVFGQSLGTAIAIALVNHLAEQTPAVSCAGLVVSAAFSDLASLTATYRVGGVIPVLSPIARIPYLFSYFTKQLHSTWLSKDRIADFIRRVNHYHINFIHAEDDPEIPCTHTERLFWHSINATNEKDIPFKQLQKEKEKKKTQLGEGGWYVEWPTKKGLIRQDMLKYGTHDRIMAYPIVAMAVLRAFQAADPNFEA